ncbi:hypothetical protein HUO09_17430 [Vibrio sp. Y2-5]|uniref:hypothetical protein n=1 Tax=Vibrio sp. Y2-5 TaxID=2743977 RepID=UPI0016612A36|nr:hypothetical protein [Vibrio sp. Y2-5]MBD0788139.1 hypothetical protein [Vibrio sp. Y2-5]
MSKPVKPLQFYALTLFAIAYSAFFVFLTFGDFDSPISNWTPYIGNFLFDNFGITASSEVHLNLFIHFVVWITIALVIVKFKERAWYGSFNAVNAAYELELRQAAFRSSIGNVLHVHVDRGSFFTNTISTIETEQGIYRVVGDVGSVQKGLPIMRTQEKLYVGVSSEEGYTFI